jgi:DNA-binding response OmpR family regulator
MYSQFKNISILLAEDEKKLALAMKTAIGEYFHDFIITYNGKEALEAYHKYLPDIVITDILMPKLTGLELMQELRKINDELAIIILSAHSDSDKLLKAIDLGVTKYFVKPVDPDELLEYISLLIPKLKKSTLIKLKNGFSFNIEERKLYLNNNIVKITKREINLLNFLLTKEEYMANNISIKKLLWKEEVSNERLRTFIRRLRAKTSKELIVNSSGLGYGLATH